MPISSTSRSTSIPRSSWVAGVISSEEDFPANSLILRALEVISFGSAWVDRSRSGHG